jgi:phage shock protein E
MTTASQPPSEAGSKHTPSAVVLSLVGMVIALLFVVACGGSSTSGTASASEFVAKAAGPGVIVLDVRTAGEYAPAHLSGAINVDVEGAGFTSQIASFDKQATYAVYCRSGRRAAIAADVMRTAGFANLVVFDGSFTDLQAAGASIRSS